MCIKLSQKAWPALCNKQHGAHTHAQRCQKARDLDILISTERQWVKAHIWHHLFPSLTDASKSRADFNENAFFTISMHIWCLTNGLKGEHLWCTEWPTACWGPSPQTDAVCLSCTALDTRDRVVPASTSQLWDALWDAIYQVMDLHTKNVTDIRHWVPPHQVGVGEPGEDHSQGWGVGHWKG